MPFLYEQYETLAEPLTMYYPTGQDELARWIFQSSERAGKLLSNLLNQPMPDMEIVLVAMEDWKDVPREDEEAPADRLPYWTDITAPSTLFVPMQLDPLIGEPSQEKLALLLYHELAHAFLESDPRPWPGESPLWTDEWPLQFAARWLFHELAGGSASLSEELRAQYADIFEPEPDGKTPVTVRGFDWYEDTSPEDYLTYVLLLEQFAADLLSHYPPEILPRFLDLYRKEVPVLLSDDATDMLASALGPGGSEWLENLVYF